MLREAAACQLEIYPKAGGPTALSLFSRAEEA